jgi:enoyl-CoA hydratase
LRENGGEKAVEAANLIDCRSPLALSVTLRAVGNAAKLESLQDVLRQEYRVSSSTLRTHDLVEGIRAQVVDKDRDPKWSPASLAAVNADDVEAFFGPVDDDLTF